MSSHCTILDNEALLHITGPDSLAFLQGQTTCDTRSVDDKQAVVGAYCTPKGRVVCDFLLSKIADSHFVMRMRQDILEASAAVFGKYIVFSKAQLQATNTDWQIVGCWGTDVATVLQEILGPFSTDSGERYSSTCGEGFVVVQTDEQATLFECYINTSSHPELLQRLTSAMSGADASHWSALQIEQGMGRIEAATIEAFIPQMLNYDLTGHISFTKGCYTGQEVVARMHYRGKPKRRLYNATLSGSEGPPAGTLLYAADSAQSVGTLVNSVIDASGVPVGLIVAPVADVPGSLHSGAPNGPELSYDSTG